MPERLPRLMLSWVVALSAAWACAEAPPPRVRATPVEAPAPAAVEASEPSDDPETEAGPGWMGVSLGADGSAEPGVLVRDVVPGSPAAQAGLLADDRLLSVDGEPVTDPESVVARVGAKHPGERAAIAYTRAGTRRLCAVQLARAPKDDELLRKTYVGARAPALADLKTVQGSVEPSLRALRGKVVVIEFWATWCFVCRMMVPTMNEWHARYGAQGVQVLGITSEPLLPAAQAAQSFGISYPLLSDESGRTTLAYRALALPTVFVIDREGTVRDVMVGYSSARLAELESLIRALVAQT